MHVQVVAMYPEPLRRAGQRANLAVGPACALYSDRAALARARALAEVTPGLQRWRALIGRFSVQEPPGFNSTAGQPYEGLRSSLNGRVWQHPNLDLSHPTTAIEGLVAVARYLTVPR